MWAARLPALALLLCALPAQAVSKSELDARLKAVERKLDSQALVQLLEQVESLQREVQQLRGEIEVQSHELQGMKKRQRDLYLDIDRRLNRLETGASNGQAAGAAVPPAPQPPAAAGSPAVPAAAPAGAPPTASAPKTAAAAGTATAREEYDRALGILRDGRYQEAAAAFGKFLADHPGSSYADNAQYWLGEVHYVTRDFKTALQEFGKVIEQYPNSPKVADARLKLGYIKYELKDWAGARRELQRVVKEFPGSTAARLAQERLERMKREGH
ncbi:MAG TPA: tol-pal system protein YbgF [Gammaproteobacteria bacterium]|nr:tol-pal system protein YbgF [Gammaproteobacteria bacterium]